ncbi:MAG TPA: carbohydrate ABC transporter permease [Clostridia bacterium]|jgi:putative aldouronate transport system permease protein
MIKGVDYAVKRNRKKNKYKEKVGDKIFNIINIFVFSLFTLLCIFPFYYIFINTISDNNLVQKGMITFYPKGIHFLNYILLKDVNDLGVSVLVTIGRTVLGTALMVLTSAFAGYLATQQKMWLRSFWYRFIVITMYFNAGLVPWYLIILNLGLTNKFLAYIIPGIVQPFNIILVKTYIESIPKEIEESAVIEGAGTLTIFFRIIWPLSIPILATITVFGAVGHWNSLQDSLILMASNPKLYTLQHRLYIYLTQTSDLQAIIERGIARKYTVDMRIIKYTISMVSIIPIMLVYPFMQRYFIKGIMLGAVKG